MEQLYHAVLITMEIITPKIPWVFSVSTNSLKILLVVLNTLIFFSSNTVKNLLCSSLSSKLSLEKDEITQIVDTVLDGVKEILSEGSSLEIRGFGTFEVKIRKGKKNARNPKTGEKVQTQPHYVICLKPGQELKDNIKKLKVID